MNNAEFKSLKYGDQIQNPGFFKGQTAIVLENKGDKGVSIAFVFSVTDPKGWEKIKESAVRDTCRLCNNPIEKRGDMWVHANGFKPRHPAAPRKD